MSRFIACLFFWVFACNATYSQRISIEREHRDSLLVIIGRNTLPAVVAVHFTSRTDDLNIKEWHRLPNDSEPHDLFQIAKSKIPDGKDFDDLIRVVYYIGDPGNAQPDKKYRYHYPFARGKASKIIQGYKGSFSHDSARSKYAIDFEMAVGDTVYAAREGVVAWLVEHNTEGGPSRKYQDKANEIVIAHEDGTLAFYSHLDSQGALVEIGDQVSKGEAIGICGLTGFTTTPHLHFVVRIVAASGEVVAIPIRFEQGKGKKLKQGTYSSH